jgi:hypothetical protein
MRSLPKSELMSVFAASAFPVYAWTLLHLFRILPSWLKFLTLAEIVSTSLYALSFALFESALILVGLALLAAILPSRFFRDQFAAQGSLLAWLFSVWMVFLQANFSRAVDWSLREFALVSVAIFLAFSLSTAVICYLGIYRIQVVRQAILSLAERMIIFLYLYVPLGVLGFVVMLARNIF